jgi:CubicO group peptidase (beta-lactamase class C family)
MGVLRRAVSGAAACALMLATCSAPRESRAQDKATAAVDEVFADFTKAGSPGCAVAVYRNGRVSYSRGYGLANIEEDVPITSESVFDIGSTSKQFTAASILLLEKQGKLSVNDDVRKYIPELPDYGPKITILHLLNHTSGLRDYLTLMDLAGINTDSVTTDEDALQIITRQKALNFAPGSDWLYSNTGFFLLSIIVKRVSGKTLREFAAENIFTPLGMTHTQYRDDHTALIPDRAMAYDPKEKKDGFKLDVSYFEQTGDGAVHTSVADLIKWDENFYSGQVGGRDFLAEIQEPGKLNSGKVLDYAKGLRIADYRGLHTVSHGGSWGGYRAELLRFPEQHFSVACLCNRGDANPTRRAHQVADIYLGSMMKPRSNEAHQEEKEQSIDIVDMRSDRLATFSGDFWSDELEVTYRFSMVNGRLRLNIIGADGGPRSANIPPDGLVAGSNDVFRIGQEFTFHFMRDATGATNGFKLDAGRTWGMIFTRRDGTGK